MLKDRTELAQHFASLNFKKGAEIGVGTGYYSKILLDNIPNLNLLSVDPWNLLRWNKIYPQAVELLSAYPNSTMLRGFSMDVVKLIPDESLDFVFIDGNHDYGPVKDDITEWSKKVRKGGIVSGHDYQYYHSNMDVVKAVDEYVAENGIKLSMTAWNRYHELRDERHPCWYFTK